MYLFKKSFFLYILGLSTPFNADIFFQTANRDIDDFLFHTEKHAKIKEFVNRIETNSEDDFKSHMRLTPRTAIYFIGMYISCVALHQHQKI